MLEAMKNAYWQPKTHQMMIVAYFMGIKAGLSKANRHNLASKITDDIFCLEKEFDHCNDFAKVLTCVITLIHFSF